MIAKPPSWTTEELSNAATIAKENFRSERLALTDEWTEYYKQAHDRFESLFKSLADLSPHAVTNERLADVYERDLDGALRYLAGPPISDDDLKVLADVHSLAPTVLRNDLQSVRKVFDVIERVIDPYRFPWVKEKREPTGPERSAALLASSVLLAAQRMATGRRNEGKTEQEGAVRSYLFSIGFKEAPAHSINTIVNGPGEGEFFRECQLGERKADIVVRLHDTRLMPIECKVSNSATNSVKRLNNDAAVKAGYWLQQFGDSQIVPAAMLSGVFKVRNLEQAQNARLAIFWAHDLKKLGDFIESTGS